MFCYVTIIRELATSASWIYKYQIEPEIRTRSCSTYFWVLITLPLEISSDLKNMETPSPCAGFLANLSWITITITYFNICIIYGSIVYIKLSGKSEWSQGLPPSILSIADDEKDVKVDNLDLIFVPQYGRNLNYIG